MSDPLTNDLASLRIRREEAPPSNRGTWLVAGAVVLVVGAGAAFGYQTYAPRFFKTAVTATTIELVSPAQASVDLTSTGYVVAQLTSNVSAQFPGRLAAVLVREGDTVKKGQVIARLDDTEQRLELAGAKAHLESAQASLADLQQQLSREQRLLQGGGSQRSTVEDLAAKVKVKEADLRFAQSDLESMSAKLGFTVISAPISGRVVNKPRQVGEFIDPSSGPLAQITDFDSLLVETDVPEGRLSKVKPGGPTEVVLDAYPDRRMRGEVTEIVPRVDRAKATVVVKVKFVDPHEGVLPDMAARVSFLQAALDQASMKEPPKLVVPASAVTERAGSKVVFTLDDGHVRMVPIVLGQKFGNGYELQSGPQSGTRVVANPPVTLTDGAPVKEGVEG